MGFITLQEGDTEKAYQFQMQGAVRKGMKLWVDVVNQLIDQALL